jgi:hypothetical protein
MPLLKSFYLARSLSLALLGSILALAAGCHCCQKNADQDIAAQNVQVERGRPAPVLDTVGWIVGIPSKIVMLNHRVNNHNVTAKTETAMEEYLVRNDLDRVKVRINEYDPKGEWHRLRENKDVAWPVRYSLGTLSWVGYTLLPGRLFGGDRYNPFTNTIDLYSDVPAIAFYEGGRAKDYAGRKHKAIYAVAGEVPGLNIIHEVNASGNAINYLYNFGTPEELKDGYRTVYPAFAIDSSESLSAFTTWPIVLPAAAAGHIAGYVKASQVKEEPKPGKQSSEQPPATQ